MSSVGNAIRTKRNKEHNILNNSTLLIIMTLPVASLGTQAVPTLLRKEGVSCSLFILETPQAAGNCTRRD